ncbi:MAG: glutamine synthetase type III, partial [Christensenellales bacterium]
PKGQELDDHYYGAINTRVVNYMKELDEELWKLGVFAKTKHNEVAPCQHELAPVYCTTTVATDHNQLTMEIMKKVALRHGFVCLLHEKPFEGVNGSGKHNNWSLSTDTGKNLLEPGSSPSDNAQFLLFVSAVIKAVDLHQDLLRLSVASAGNDHRLGANEAPPAIVSMYLGDEITGILSAIEEKRTYSKRAKCNVEIGVHVLPKLSKDSTDRNRTSPFAFTGNKFEFRMPGSTFSIAGINTVLNTIVADVLEEFADRLEGRDLADGVREIVADTMAKHKRIIFNGNNYSAEWVSEAERRGLLNLRSTPEALACFDSERNVRLFEKHGVLTEQEIASRKEILTENYCKVIRIEARTMADMARSSILPCVMDYISDLTSVAVRLDGLFSGDDFGFSTAKEEIKKVCRMYDSAKSAFDKLVSDMEEANSLGTGGKAAERYRDKVIPSMKRLRVDVDALETEVPKKYWPYPSYGDILFG